MGLRRFIARLRNLPYRLSERYHDWRLGISSRDVILPKSLGITNPDCKEYVPTTYRDFSIIIKKIGVRPNLDVFLDLGCGLGRVLILAARHPFKRVIGVEYSPALADDCRNHVARAKCSRLVEEVSIVTADAGEYEVPTDVSVVFFYHSFHGETFSRFLARLEESYRTSPRTITFIATGPHGSTHIHERIDVLAWLTLRERFSLPSGRYCAIYVAK